MKFIARSGCGRRIEVWERGHPRSGATMNERDVFINALQKDPSERPAYLDEACAANPALRRRHRRVA